MNLINHNCEIFIYMLCIHEYIAICFGIIALRYDNSILHLINNNNDRSTYTYTFIYSTFFSTLRFICTRLVSVQILKRLAEIQSKIYLFLVSVFGSTENVVVSMLKFMHVKHIAIFIRIQHRKFRFETKIFSC